MLVLTRKMGEVVKIGRDVEVFVVGVSSGRVKLGFRAPREVPIQRGEIAHNVETSVETPESDLAPAPSVLARTDRNEFLSPAPLRSIRQLRPV
jgi:carbon storage regulator